MNEIILTILFVVLVSAFCIWLFPIKDEMSKAIDKKRRERENKPFFDKNKLKIGKDIIVTGDIAHLDGDNKDLVFFKYCSKTKTLIKLK